MDIKRVYLDYQATTPCDNRVVNAMIPYFYEEFGNTGSKNHAYGWRAEEAVERAREIIAHTINADSKEIIFTSGATESNNLALQGMYNFHKNSGRTHIITSVIEHKCILETCKFLEKNGARVTYLPVNSDGLISLEKLENAIEKDTLMVSIIAVNNEIGVIQDIDQIGAICAKHNVYFHTDGAQALGKISLNVKQNNIHLMSLSAHKVYGPAGIGALYMSKNPRIRLAPIFHGGGQERGARPGTLPLPLCVGFGKACEIIQKEQDIENERIQKLWNFAYEEIISKIDDVKLNGSKNFRVPHNLNLNFAYIEGESLMMDIDNIALSSGSACTSSSLESSYVLKAIGISDLLAHSSIRIGIGRFTTQKEIEYLISKLIVSVNKLRNISPLYEMAKEGVNLEKYLWKNHE